MFRHFILCKYNTFIKIVERIKAGGIDCVTCLSLEATVQQHQIYFSPSVPFTPTPISFRPLNQKCVLENPCLDWLWCIRMNTQKYTPHPCKTCLWPFNLFSRFCACLGSQEFTLCSGLKQSQFLRFYTAKCRRWNLSFTLHIGDQKSFCLDHILFRRWILVLFCCSST